MWHRDMKWAKVFEKMVPINLIEVALPQILNLFKKKKVLSSKHNKTVYAYTFFWVLLNTQLP